MLSDERHAIATELNPPFTIANRNAISTPFVFCSPHSGRVYPKNFLKQTQLDARTLRKSEDYFIDHIFSPAAQALPAPLICARFPRAYVDVNREPYELDARLFQEPLPDFANKHTTRVAGGLGTIARIVADGEEIYPRPIPLALALERINRLYDPFHKALCDLLDARQARFGYAVLIDCHSMPSISMAPTIDERPDIVLGDRFGASCDGDLSGFIKQSLQDMGYSVGKNQPYAGGFITEHYGTPINGRHAIQIEINRGLYMNEQRLEPSLGYGRLKRDLALMAGQLPSLSAYPSAAE